MTGNNQPTTPDAFFHSKIERINSFKLWPLSFIRPGDLAAACFYYYPQHFDCCDGCDSLKLIDDRVQCFCCEIELVQWEDIDDPMLEDQNLFP